MTQQFGLDDFLKHIKNKPDDQSNENSNKSASNRSASNMSSEPKFSAQMQKKINEFFKSDTPDEQQKPKGLLDKRAFVFIPFPPDLDKKKIDALTERIRRNGGITFRVDFYDWKPSTSLDVYIVVTKEMSFQNLLESIPPFIQERLNKFTFIDWRWITDCLRERELMDVNKYVIDWKKVKETDNLKRLEQIMREEEQAGRKDQFEKEMIIGESIDDDEVIPIKDINEKRGFDELKKVGERDEKLVKKGEEDEEIEEIEKPRKKLRIRENEEVMNACRYLYDYRFGIEEEGKEAEEEEKDGKIIENNNHKDVMEIEDSPEKPKKAEKPENSGKMKVEEMLQVPKVQVKSPPIRVTEELKVPKKDMKSPPRGFIEELLSPKIEHNEPMRYEKKGPSSSKGFIDELLSHQIENKEDTNRSTNSGRMVIEELKVPKQGYREDSRSPSFRGSDYLSSVIESGDEMKSLSRGYFEDLLSPKIEQKEDTNSGRIVMEELKVPKAEHVEEPKSPKSPSRNAFDLMMGKNKGAVKTEPKSQKESSNAFDMMMGKNKGGVKTEPTSHKDNNSTANIRGQRSPRATSNTNSARGDDEETKQAKHDKSVEVLLRGNLNQHLTDEFEKLLKAYITKKDKGRMHAYRNGIAAIKSVPFRIENADQVKGVAGIGTKIRDKINEILSTGKLKKAVELTDEKQTVINLLTKVWGVGSQTATSLYEKGIKDIETLRKHQYLLTDNQKVGLKYFEDFEQRIPRDEIGEIVQIITEKVNELAGGPGIYDVTCCGSYRRGRATCGDIDILMSREDGKPFDGFLNRVVRGLEKILITDHLTKAKMSPLGSETYMGVLKHNGIHRRIDMKIYPKDQYGYALVYFTGSDQFNRSIRMIALNNNLSLSDHGLSRVEKSEKGKQTMIPENIPCYTEHEVFDVIGIKYKSPEERDI